MTSTMTSKAGVSIKDVAIRFGAVRVLEQMSIDVAPGEFLVLLGPSGCGKSTLLNAIAGLIDVQDGEIWINGRNVTWDEPSDRGIGMVFQSYALYPTMSVRKNLSFGLTIAGVDKAEIERRVARAADILQIGPLMERKPAELSGGQRQRVAIGRALVRDVGVFLFDEPLSNLDAKLRGELRVEIKRLHRDLRNTMIYVTHDQIEAMTLADRIAVMRSGVVQQLGTPDEIYNRPATRFVAAFIGSPTMNFINGEVGLGDTGPVFVCDDGVIPLGFYEFAGQPAPGKATLGIRPEHFRITRGGGLPGIAATVEMVENLGADAIAWLTGRTGTISVRIEPTDRYAAGETVTLVPDVGRAALFDATTEQRL